MIDREMVPDLDTVDIPIEAYRMLVPQPTAGYGLAEGHSE